MRISKIHVTVDIVLLRKTAASAQILLIQRKNDPFQNQWALPGGFVEEHEDLADAAHRELFEETGIRDQPLKQLHAFGTPGRDPRGHMVSIAYICWVGGDLVPIAGDDAADAKWFSVNDLPKVAFDHSQIISFALTKI